MTVRPAFRSEVSDSAIGGSPKRSRTPSTPFGFQKRMNTTIFVKNAPSYSGLGFDGEGFTTMTIATPTGEGVTSARTFTRLRRCVLYGDFRIV